MIIGLCGPEGAGKSTAAKLLAASDSNFTILPFAAPLKRMLAALGVPDANLYGTPHDKEQPLEILSGKSARHAMQTLGTEWGRQQMDAGFWLNAWKALAANRGNVVADDVRFPNEADAIRAMDGKVICIVKSMQDFRRTPKHASENFAAIARDVVIVNDGSLEKLKEDLMRAAAPTPYQYRSGRIIWPAASRRVS